MDMELPACTDAAESSLTQHHRCDHLAERMHSQETKMGFYQARSRQSHSKPVHHFIYPSINPGKNTQVITSKRSVQFLRPEINCMVPLQPRSKQ